MSTFAYPDNTTFVYTRANTTDPNHFACVMIAVNRTADTVRFYTYATWTDYTNTVVESVKDARVSVRELLNRGFVRNAAKEAEFQANNTGVQY